MRESFIDKHVDELHKNGDDCVLKVGDTVKVIAGYMCGRIGKIIKIDTIEPAYRISTLDGPHCFFYKFAYNLELVKPASEKTEEKNESIRTFETGATRDTSTGKLDYVKALSPIVLKRFVEYLDKHRLQPDGSYRDFDNWKHGMPQEVYHSSNGRHFWATWMLTEGYEVKDNHGPVDLEDSLCAEMFNVMGRLKEVLEARGYCKSEQKDKAYYDGITKMIDDKEIDRTKPVPGGY